MRFKNELELARDFEEFEKGISLFKSFGGCGVHSKFMTDRARLIRRLEVTPEVRLAKSSLVDVPLDTENLGPVFEINFLHGVDFLTFPFPIHYYMEEFPEAKDLRIGSGRGQRTFRHGFSELKVGYGPTTERNSQFFRELTCKLHKFRVWIQAKAGVLPNCRKRELVL